MMAEEISEDELKIQCPFRLIVSGPSGTKKGEITAGGGVSMSIRHALF